MSIENERATRRAAPEGKPGLGTGFVMPEETIIIANRYEVRRHLGSGGMAHVYLAWDRQFEREVAVKVLRRDLAADPKEVERFRSEAKLLARVSSEHVVQIYDMHFGDDLCYLVLRRLVGNTLDHVIAEKGSLGPVTALQLACEVLLGLATLHGNAVLHRDIKPSNVLIGDDQRAILLDLGVAIDHSAGVGASTSMTSGTPAFMAPEQRLSGKVDVRSEIYQVGLLLMYAVTGADILRGELDMKAVLAAMPLKIAEIVQRAIHQDPNARYQTATEMYTAAMAASQESETVPIRITLNPSSTVTIGPAPAPLAIHSAVPQAHLARVIVEPGLMAADATRKIRLWRRAAVGVAAITAVVALCAFSAPQLLAAGRRSTPATAHAAPPAVAHAAPRAATLAPAPAPVVATIAAPPAPAEIEMPADAGIAPAPAAAPVVPVAKQVGRRAPAPAPAPHASGPVTTPSAVAPHAAVDAADALSSNHAVPTTATEFLVAAQHDEQIGATEAAIASYRQYLRLAPDDAVRAHVARLEAR